MLIVFHSEFTARLHERECRNRLTGWAPECVGLAPRGSRLDAAYLPSRRATNIPSSRLKTSLSCSMTSVGIHWGFRSSILGLEIPLQGLGFLAGSGVLVVIGVALIALGPARKPVKRSSALVP